MSVGGGSPDLEPEPGSVPARLRGLAGAQTPGEGDGDGGGRGGDRVVGDGGRAVAKGGLDPEPDPGLVSLVRLRGLAGAQTPGEGYGDGGGRGGDRVVGDGGRTVAEGGLDPGPGLAGAQAPGEGDGGLSICL